MSRTQDQVVKSKLARSETTTKNRTSAPKANNALSVQGHSYKH